MDLFSAPCRIGRSGDDATPNSDQSPNVSASSPRPSHSIFKSFFVSVFGAYEKDLEHDWSYLTQHLLSVDNINEEMINKQKEKKSKPKSGRGESVLASNAPDCHDDDDNGRNDGDNQVPSLPSSSSISSLSISSSFSSAPSSLRKALLSLYGVPIFVSGVIAALKTASNVAAVHLLSLFLKWMTDFALAELLYLPSVDELMRAAAGGGGASAGSGDGAIVAAAVTENATSSPSPSSSVLLLMMSLQLPSFTSPPVADGLFYAFAIGVSLTLSTLCDKVGVLRAFFRMRSVLTVMVADRLGKCAVDDNAAAGNNNDPGRDGSEETTASSTSSTSVKRKAASLIDMRLPLLPSLGGKYFHLWWTTLCMGAAVTCLLISALEWVGALFLPIIFVGYCHLLPIAVAEGAAAADVAVLSLRRVAFMGSVFDSVRVIKGNSWTQWTFAKIRTARAAEVVVKFTHVFRQFLLGVSTTVSDLTISVTYFAVIYNVGDLRDSVLTPSNILAANAYCVLLRMAFTYTPMSVMAWRDIVSIIDECANFLSETPLHVNEVKTFEHPPSPPPHHHHHHEHEQHQHHPSSSALSYILVKNAQHNHSSSPSSCCFVLENIDVKKSEESKQQQRQAGDERLDHRANTSFHFGNLNSSRRHSAFSPSWAAAQGSRRISRKQSMSFTFNNKPSRSGSSSSSSSSRASTPLFDSTVRSVSEEKKKTENKTSIQALSPSFLVGFDTIVSVLVDDDDERAEEGDVENKKKTKNNNNPKKDRDRRGSASPSPLRLSRKGSIANSSFSFTTSFRSLGDAVNLNSCSLSIPSHAITVVTGPTGFLKLLAGEVQFSQKTSKADGNHANIDDGGGNGEHRRRTQKASEETKEEARKKRKERKKGKVSIENLSDNAKDESKEGQGDGKGEAAVFLDPHELDFVNCDK